MSYAGRGVKGHFAAHARYLMRDSATNGIETFGTAVDRPLHVTLGSWQQAGDKRLWKLIVSPEFGDRVNLTELTKGLMGAIEHDLNRRLLWAAVEHRNTDHPHVHIALRSVDADGREFRFEPEYLKTAVRNHAQYLCTQQIGNRSYDDIRMAHEREVDQLRFTLLDRRLVRLAELAPREDPSGGQRLSYPQEPLLRARLQFLTQAGIARDLGQGEYVIPDGLEWQLRQMANAADRQRMLAHSGVVISDHRLPQRVTPAKDTGELRGRVLGHAEDERTERPFLILEGTDGVVHFIPHDDRIGMARSQGKLEPNHFISFEGGCLTDLGNADSYLTGRTFRAMPLPTELASASHGWRGWLGRYYLTLLPQAPAREHESLIERVAAELSDIER